VELWLYFAEGNCVKFYLCVVFNHPISTLEAYLTLFTGAGYQLLVISESRFEGLNPMTGKPE